MFCCHVTSQVSQASRHLVAELAAGQPLVLIMVLDQGDLRPVLFRAQQAAVRLIACNRHPWTVMQVAKADKTRGVRCTFVQTAVQPDMGVDPDSGSMI